MSNTYYKVPLVHLFSYISALVFNVTQDSTCAIDVPLSSAFRVVIINIITSINTLCHKPRRDVVSTCKIGDSMTNEHSARCTEWLHKFLSTYLDLGRHVGQTRHRSNHRLHNHFHHDSHVHQESPHRLSIHMFRNNMCNVLLTLSLACTGPSRVVLHETTSDVSTSQHLPDRHSHV